MKLLLIYGIVLVLIELTQGTTAFDDNKCTVLDDLQQVLNTDWSLSSNTSDISCLYMQNSNVEYLTNNTFNILPNLQYLNLTGNNIQNRNLDFVSRMQNIKTLVLDKAYKKSGAGEFLLNAESETLESLFLSNNGIGKLIISSKMHLERLITLALDNNEIEEISTEVNGVLLRENFNWLPESLKYLNIANNKLKELIIINKTELYELNAQWNELNTLTLENLPNLVNLYIREKSLHEISIKNLPKLKDLTLELLNSERILYSHIKNLPSLELLNLNCNNLLYFDGKIITQLQSLRTLIIENGSLTTIPKMQNKNLLNLRVSHNKIKELQAEDFSATTNLEELNLSHNSIKFIESSTFLPLKNLRILNLEHNVIEIASPYTFNVFSSLKVLKISNNRLRCFDGIIVDNNPELIELDLGNNLLNTFPTINNGGNLKNIYLNNNQIKELKADDINSGLTKLKTLYLSYNSLSLIEDKVFDRVKNLMFLYLHSNELKIMPTNWFSTLMSLTRVTLDMNKFTDFKQLSLNLTNLKNIEISYSFVNDDCLYCSSTYGFNAYCEFVRECMKERVCGNSFDIFNKIKMVP